MTRTVKGTSKRDLLVRLNETEQKLHESRETVRVLKVTTIANFLLAFLFVLIFTGV